MAVKAVQPDRRDEVHGGHLSSMVFLPGPRRCGAYRPNTRLCVAGTRPGVGKSLGLAPMRRL